MSTTQMTAVDTMRPTKRWTGIDWFSLGPWLKEVRKDTPSFDGRTHKGTGIPMSCSRREVVKHINAHLDKKSGELPISEAILARFENGQNVYGGYVMRAFQVAWALEVKLTFEGKLRRGKSPW